MFITPWIIIGLALGSIARIAMPGPAAGGMRVAMLIGVIGALIGGIVGTLSSPNAPGPFDLYASLTAAAGAMYPLFLYRCFALRFENRTHSPSQSPAEKRDNLSMKASGTIPVTFDRDYVDTLDDYYRRNECIREQQYLSQEKLLHLAAFCMSKVVNVGHENGDSRWNDQKAEAAFDAVRELALLCETADHAAAQFEPVTIVNGQTIDERQNQEQKSTASGTATLVERMGPPSPRVQ